MNALLQEKIAGMISNAQHILLLTDERIDGDTTGSTMGLYHVLSDLGKRVEVFSPKPLPAMFEFLPKVNVIRRDEEVFNQASIDLLIICDCSDGVYIQKLLPLMPRKAPLVVFDHHATNPRYGTVNYIEEKAASTADVVWRFAKDQGFPIDKDAAHCFLTGICTDTVLFSTANTTKACIEASAELTTSGAKLHEIVRHTLMQRSVTSLKLWGLAMERLFHDDVLDATATAITQQDIVRLQATTEDLEGVSGFLNAMLDDAHDVVVVYRETEDGAVKGSMRSRGRNVADQAERLFGGGGHKLAAGFKIPHAHLEERDGKWLVVKSSKLADTVKS